MRRHVDRGAEHDRIEEQVREGVVRRIPGKQERDPAERHAEDEADVLAAALARRQRRDLQRADPETVARGERAAGHARALRTLAPEAAERHVLHAARLRGEPHVVAVEDREESGAVVLVRVREHDEVDPPLPRGEAAAEQGEEASGIRTTVDEDDRAAELQQERIALTDIERADAGHRSGRAENARADNERGEHKTRGRAHADTRPRRARRGSADAVRTGQARHGARRGEHDLAYHDSERTARHEDPAPDRGERAARGKDNSGGEHEHDRGHASARDLGARPGEVRRELDRAPHRGRDRVAREAERARGVGDDRPERGGRHAETEQRGEERDGDQVRERRDERHATERRRDDRDRRQARGERGREAFARDRREAFQPRGDGLLQPEQPRGRCNAQLEADGRRDRRVERDEHAHRQAERVRAGRGAADRETDGRDEGHHPGAEHARRRSDEQRVERERRASRDRDAERR